MNWTAYISWPAKGPEPLEEIDVEAATPAEAEAEVRRQLTEGYEPEWRILAIVRASQWRVEWSA